MSELNEHLIAELKARYPYQFKNTSWELPAGWIPIMGLLAGLLDEHLEKSGFKTLGEKSNRFGGWTQLKEKFGGARFYRTFGERATDALRLEIGRLIKDAENLAWHSCEVCGAVGDLRGDLAWNLTLCDLHYAERIKRDKGGENDE